MSFIYFVQYAGTPKRSQMQKLEEQVKSFMIMGNQPIGTLPSLPIDETVSAGIELIKEELEQKLIPTIQKFRQENAVGASDTRCVELLAKIADAFGDLLYVTMCNCIIWGFPMEEVLEEIQKANMLKVKTPYEKVTGKKFNKPEGWTSPDISKILTSLIKKGQRL